MCIRDSIDTALETPVDIDGFQTVNNVYNATKFDLSTVNVTSANYTITTFTTGSVTVLDFLAPVPDEFRIAKSVVIRGCNESILNGNFTIVDIGDTLSTTMSIDVDSTGLSPTTCNILQPGQYVRTEDKGLCLLYTSPSPRDRG